MPSIPLLSMHLICIILFELLICLHILLSCYLTVALLPAPSFFFLSLFRFFTCMRPRGNPQISNEFQNEAVILLLLTFRGCKSEQKAPGILGICMENTILLDSLMPNDDIARQVVEHSKAVMPKCIVGILNAPIREY